MAEPSPVEILLLLASETRDEVRRINAVLSDQVSGLALLAHRLDDLEDVSVIVKAKGKKHRIARDASLTAGVGAVVAVVMQVLQALAPAHPASVSTPHTEPPPASITGK